MKKQFLKRVSIAVGVIIGTIAMSGEAARATTNPKVISQRNTAKELAGIMAKTKSDWLWALGEGTEQATESYVIKRSNSFFQSLAIAPRPDQLFNRNNNVGDPIPEYGEVELLRF